MYPPMDPTSDPLGLGPAPTAPAAPQTVQPKSMPMAAKVILTALGGLMGPGRGTGLLQGVNLADQQARQRAVQENAQVQQDWQRQHLAFQDAERAYQQQQAQRAATLKQMVDSFSSELANTQTDAEAESLYNAAGNAFQSMGFRGFDVPNLKRRFKSPTMVDRATAVFNKFMSNPANKLAFQNNPESLADATIGDVGGVPMTFRQYAELSHTMIPQAKPKDAPKPPTMGSFEDYMARTYGDNPTPDQILEGRKNYNQADDRAPRVTVNTPGASAGAFPPAIQSRIDAKGKEFNAQPVVKRIQQMAEAVSFADAMDPQTKNPNDDQALIYAFAKAMDPDSVVREGEYATVQKYAQSWAESFGFNAQRIFSNSAFLTPQARTNMKATIRAKYASAVPQYRNVRKNYIGQVDRIIGARGAGSDWIVDYEAAFPQDQQPQPAAPDVDGARARARDLYKQRGAK